MGVPRFLQAPSPRIRAVIVRLKRPFPDPTGRCLERLGSASNPDVTLQPSGRMHVCNQDPLGPDPGRLPDRPILDLGRDTMDRVAARLPGPAGHSLVPSRRHAGLLPTGPVLVVVFLRRLCSRHLRDRRPDRRFGRSPGDRCRRRHVGLAGPGSEERRDLRLRPLGDTGGDRSRRPDGGGWCDARPPRQGLSSPRRSGACALLRPDPVGQGCRPRGAHPTDLARLRHRP